jgi:Zn-dependent protease/predicted transcriptional regulator
MHAMNWQLGRLLGIPIRIHPSWFLIFAFVTWSLATGYLPETLPGLGAVRYWLMGSVATMLLFASVLLHELGHSYVALRYRIPIAEITLFIFGGVAQMRREPPGPRAEFFIAIAGPLVSFVLGALLLGMAALMEGRGLVALGVLIGSVNIQLGLFNLIPGFPLDGGRVLRAGLRAWSGDLFRATRQASLVGQGFGLLFASVGGMVMLSVASGWVPPILAANGGWVLLIGVFLFVAARGTRRQAALRASLAQQTVGNVMIRDVVTVPSQLSVEDAVTHYFVRYGYDSFPVVEHGQLIGVLSTRDLQDLPRLAWSSRSVRDVMQPRSDSSEISPRDSAMQALEQMLRHGLSRLVVIDDGQLVGLLTRSAMNRLLKLRSLAE